MSMTTVCNSPPTRYTRQQPHWQAESEIRSGAGTRRERRSAHGTVFRAGDEIRVELACAGVPTRTLGSRAAWARVEQQCLNGRLREILIEHARHAIVDHVDRPGDGIRRNGHAA